MRAGSCRSTSLALGLVGLLLPGCALYDGLFGADDVEAKTICERFVPQLEACGEQVSQLECESVVSCLDSHRSAACEDAWRELVQCVFDDDEPECSAEPDSVGVCEGSFEGYINCLGGEGDSAVLSCFPQDPLCEGSTDPMCGAPCGADPDCGPSGRCVDGACEPAPCDPEVEPSCGGCMTTGCPADRSCDLVTGQCVAGEGEPCSSAAECPAGSACVSPSELCFIGEGRFRDAMPCDALPKEPVCLAPCSSGGECVEGERCWPLPGDVHLEVPGPAHCAPGVCSVTADVCPQLDPGSVCVDETNGAGSGTCGVPCDPSLCQPGVCDACSTEQPSCVPREITAEGSPVFLCAGAPPEVPTGHPCDGGLLFSCEPGSFCRDDASGELACTPYCPDPGAPCADGSVCQQMEGADVGYCLVENDVVVTGCTLDAECGADGKCRSVRSACEGSIGILLSEESCTGNLDDEQQCRASCVVGGPPTCPTGERCWPDPEGGDPLSGFCAPGGCSVDAECTEVPNSGVCFDDNNGSGSGLCGARCDPSLCIGSGCDCPQPDSSCSPTLQDGADIAFVCFPGGPRGESESCAFAPDQHCAAGLGCIQTSATAAAACTSYCDATATTTCPNGEICEQVTLSGAVEVDICGGPSTGTGLADGSTCNADHECQSGACTSVEDACSSGTLTPPTNQTCSDPPPTQQPRLCRKQCQRDDDCAVAAGERCYRENTGASFCAPAMCDSITLCALSTNQCADGVCGRACDPSVCMGDPLTCACDDATLETCTQLSSSAGDMAYVCRYRGPVAIGESCDDTMDCVADSICTDANGDGAQECTQLCRSSFDCSNGTCDLSAGGTVGTCQAP